MADNDEIAKKFQDEPETSAVKLEVETEEKKSSKNKIIKAINFLTENFDFRFNKINTDTEFRVKGAKEYQYLDDPEYRDVFVDVKTKCCNISDQDFKSIVYGTRLAKRYDPFKEYLYDLPKWDGNDYIKEFLQQVVLKDETKRAYFVDGFKKWFVALVVSLVIDIPDRKYINQCCLVLVGGQGKFKTTFLKSIVPAHLQLRYYYDSTFSMHLKDHEKFLGYKMMINLDEMASMNKNDIESIKSRITQDQVVVRLPYAKADIHLKRRASFCGSVNNKEYLRDDTGTRRFFTVEIETINLAENFQLDKMYAQALSLFKQGFQYWFDSEDIKTIELNNADFILRGFEEEYLLKYFRKPQQSDYENKSVEYLSASEIADHIRSKVEAININNTVIKNIGTALSKNGFEKKSRRLNDTVTKLWAVKKVLDPRTYDINDPLYAVEADLTI